MGEKMGLIVWVCCSYDSGLYPAVDATMNWWGQGRQSYVDGRIWHQDDDTNLIQVVYQPFHEKNTSLTEGELLGHVADGR